MKYFFLFALLLMVLPTVAQEPCDTILTERYQPDDFHVVSGHSLEMPMDHVYALRNYPQVLIFAAGEGTYMAVKEEEKETWTGFPILWIGANIGNFEIESIEFVQLNGAGREELIFRWASTESNGSGRIHKEGIEIWDLDKTTCVLSEGTRFEIEEHGRYATDAAIYLVRSITIDANMVQFHEEVDESTESGKTNYGYPDMAEEMIATSKVGTFRLEGTTVWVDADCK